jgi:hypothetical protein
VVVMVGVVMTVVPASSESRSSNYQQQERGKNELLHGVKRSTILGCGCDWDVA